MFLYVQSRKYISCQILERTKHMLNAVHDLCNQNIICFIQYDESALVQFILYLVIKCCMAYINLDL